MKLNGIGLPVIRRMGLVRPHDRELPVRLWGKWGLWPLPQSQMTQFVPDFTLISATRSHVGGASFTWRVGLLEGCF